MWRRRLTAVSLCGAAACSHATHLIRCKLHHVQCAGLVASALLFLPCSSFPLQPVEQLTPLDGEDRMWDAQAPRNMRWGRLAATIALLAGGGFLVGRSMVMQGSSSSSMVPPPTAPVTSSAAAAAVTSRSSAAVAQTHVAAPVAASLTRAEAAAVIGKWQAAKAAALGPKHDVKGLASILRGEVLDQWRQRAQQIQRKGW